MYMWYTADMQSKHPIHIKQKELKNSLGYIARMSQNKQTHEDPGSESVYMAVQKRTQEARVFITVVNFKLLVTSGISVG